MHIQGFVAGSFVTALAIFILSTITYKVAEMKKNRVLDKNNEYRRKHQHFLPLEDLRQERNVEKAANLSEYLMNVSGWAAAVSFVIYQFLGPA